MGEGAMIASSSFDSPCIEVLETVDSTNSEARRRVDAGEYGPLWLRAERQTAGRGRRGRAWSGLEGNLFTTGLYRLSASPAEIAQLSFADPLSRVFTNLIDNALTFSPVGGQIQILATAQTHNGQNVWIVRVIDQGPGISAEASERIFERFYTRRPEGAAFGNHSGLGLAICRQIVQAHGGSIFVDQDYTPEPAYSGAVFTVILPYAAFNPETV